MATVRIPSSWALRNTRIAISLRLATSNFEMIFTGWFIKSSFLRRQRPETAAPDDDWITSIKPERHRPGCLIRVSKTAQSSRLQSGFPHAKTANSLPRSAASEVIVRPCGEAFRRRPGGHIQAVNHYSAISYGACRPSLSVGKSGKHR